MPKKFRGENTKAVEARARRSAAADAARTKKEKEAEDAYWADDDKSHQKKQQRKAAREQKKTGALSKKKEREELYNSEMDSLKSVKPASKPTQKVTRAQITENIERQKAEQEKKDTKEEVLEIEENINRVVNDLATTGDTIQARSVEDAISALSVAGELERHPERRLKAAYAKYEEENLPRLKKENPNLRMSQLKQMLRKDWMKSPENPMNQVFVSYNSKS